MDVVEAICLLCGLGLVMVQQRLIIRLWLYDSGVTATPDVFPVVWDLRILRGRGFAFVAFFFSESVFGPP